MKEKAIFFIFGVDTGRDVSKMGILYGTKHSANEIRSLKIESLKAVCVDAFAVICHQKYRSQN